MTIKTVKHQIKAVEKQLCFHRKDYIEKRTSYKKHAVKVKYLWFLLPISAFAIGYRKNIMIIMTVIRVLKSQGFYWLRQNVQSKLIMAVLE